MMDLVRAIRDDKLTLTNILRAQQEYHEQRRWSVFDVLKTRRPHRIDPRDRAALWHAARAELTTQPAGIRLAVDGVKLANEIRSANPVGAIVLHAAAAWSARYWLEEEAHHEVAYGMLLEMLGDAPIPEDEVVEHRGFFPEDNYARVCVLQACVETEAAVTYGEMAKKAHDPLVRDVFLAIMRDEVQHRQYFASFAQALVDAEVYPAKDVLAMAFTWLRPNGETHGSKREKQSEREGFVNWWERVRTGDDDDLALHDEQIRSAQLQAKKERSILKVVAEATGQRYATVHELQRGYFRSLVAGRRAESGVSMIVPRGEADADVDLASIAAAG
ncbi:MAG: hypothetical protein KF819_28810 [Labilithrix sp.]|nr:hypothetical protein [Labilithrix sp.]